MGMITTLFLPFLLSSGWVAASAPEMPGEVACTALTDMTAPSEAEARDGQGKRMKFDWFHHGRVGMGNDPSGFTQILPWSTVVAAPDNRLATARIEVRNARLMIQSRKTGRWSSALLPTEWTGTNLAHQLANRRVSDLELEHSGAVSSLSVHSSSVAHFWPRNGRRDIDPDDIGAVLVSVEARMDSRDYERGGRYLMNVAADYWRERRAKWDNLKSNNDVGIGRMKYLTPKWRSFTMTTLPLASLARECR